MLGPIIWLAIAFALLLALRVVWLILLQPRAPLDRTPNLSHPDAAVIDWDDASEADAAPTQHHSSSP